MPDKPSADILANIQKHITLTEKEKEIFLSMLVPKRLRKRQYLLQEGDICKHSAFVTSGCLRAYSIDGNGFEHILQFAIEDWWIADMYSYISQKPGLLNIDAIEDAEMLLLSKADQVRLYEEVPKFERFFRIIVENSLVASQQRVIENMSLPAIERYKLFFQRYPAMINRLPQTQVAGFLGITPEFLSKLRHQLMYQKP